MFGRNVNMPIVLEDKLPALESNTTSDIDIMYVHMLMKVSIMVIKYITSGGKEVVGVVQLQSWDKMASLL